MSKETLHKKWGIQFFAEEGAGSNGEGEGASGQEGQNDQSSAKTFTQEDVTRLMANEKRTARSALLKELGYEVKDGKFSDTIADIKKVLDAGKTQQQLDQEARTAAENDLAAERSKTSALQARVDVMTAGVKPEYVSDAIAMLAPQVTEQKPLSKLLEEYKTKYPVWFGESGGSQGTGGAVNPPRGKGGDLNGMGKRLAQSNKHNAPAKSAYFKT